MSSIARNTLYNLAGFVIPLALFAATIPAYVWLLGAARYGVLAIVWLILGLSGFMDLGLGRAATQKIASLRDASRDERKASLDSALIANIPVSVVSALIVAGLTWYVFGSVMKLEPWLRQEAVEVALLLLLGVPVVTTIGILNGALQGQEKFLISNQITVVNSAVFQLAPLAVGLVAGPRLWPLVLAAIMGRSLACWLLWRECRKEFGAGAIRWRKGDMSAMLRYGGWVAGAGLVGMVLVFLDRFIIGAAIGAVAIAAYTIAHDATRRFSILPDALSNTLFPRFASAEGAQSDQLATTANDILYLIATPAIAGFIILCDPIFRLWLGAELGAQSAPIGQILALAGWVNIFAKAPYARLQAEGRPHMVTLILLAELPLYLPMLWWAVHSHGLVGAAWTCFGRTAFDTVALILAARRKSENRIVLACTCVALAGLVLVLQSSEPLTEMPALALSVVAAGVMFAVGWFAVAMRTRSMIFDTLPFLRRR